MTRINVIPVKNLEDAHLRAEVRELTRIPNGVVSGKFKLDGNYPKEYTLGTGHVKFFIPRLGFLKKRYLELIEECHKRGFKTTHHWPENVPERFMKDWTPTEQAAKINLERLRIRLPKKPKYYGKDVSNFYGE